MRRRYLSESSAVRAGVVWAGNALVTDTINALDKRDRYSATNTPLAMYRGSEDTVMTPWAQTEVQAKFNSTGVRCDLYGAQGVSTFSRSHNRLLDFLSKN